MIFSESLYFLLLFTLPAAVHVIYNTRIRRVPVLNPDKSVELAECVVFCLAVFFLNLLMLRNSLLCFAEYLLVADSEKELFSVTNNFDYVSFMIKYFVVNMINAIVVVVVWNTVGQWLCRKARNVINKKIGWDEELKYNDVWRNVFETKQFFDISECVVKIEKGGALVTAGFIQMYPSPSQEKKELTLYNTDFIKELFEDDKNKKPEERIFMCAISEYYDLGNDVLIKFYKADKYDSLYG